MCVSVNKCVHLTLEVSRDHINHFEWRLVVTESQRHMEEDMLHYVINAIPADGLAPPGACPSAGTGLTKSRMWSKMRVDTFFCGVRSDYFCHCSDTIHGLLGHRWTCCTRDKWFSVLGSDTWYLSSKHISAPKSLFPLGPYSKWFSVLGSDTWYLSSKHISAPKSLFPLGPYSKWFSVLGSDTWYLSSKHISAPKSLCPLGPFSKWFSVLGSDTWYLSSKHISAPKSLFPLGPFSKWFSVLGSDTWYLSSKHISAPKSLFPLGPYSKWFSVLGSDTWYLSSKHISAPKSLFPLGPYIGGFNEVKEVAYPIYKLYRLRVKGSWEEDATWS